MCIVSTKTRIWLSDVESKPSRDDNRKLSTNRMVGMNPRVNLCSVLSGTQFVFPVFNGTNKRLNAYLELNIMRRRQQQGFLTFQIPPNLSQ